MKLFIKILKFSVPVYLIFLIVYIGLTNRNVTCNSVTVFVADSSTYKFVTTANLKNILKKEFPNLVGNPIDSIDFNAIERRMEKNPAVKKCTVYSNIFGNLKVSVEQYKPLVRVFWGNISFYFDETGHQIPVSETDNPRLLVVSGKFLADKNDQKRLIEVVKFIENSDFWRSQIVQIYIAQNNDYILIPRVGEHKIVLGTPDDYEKKFAKLKAFYKQTDPKIWNLYKVISLKYRNQIVCSKNNNI